MKPPSLTTIVAVDVGLGGVPLRFERIELQLESFFGGLTCVDGAAHSAGAVRSNVLPLLPAIRRPPGQAEMEVASPLGARDLEGDGTQRWEIGAGLTAGDGIRVAPVLLPDQPAWQRSAGIERRFEVGRRCVTHRHACAPHRAKLIADSDTPPSALA